jgi:hypothetical protein
MVATQGRLFEPFMPNLTLFLDWRQAHKGCVCRMVRRGPTMTDKDTKNKPDKNGLHGIAANDIAARHGPKLPYIGRRVRRAIDASVKPTGPKNDPCRDLELLWAIARCITTREGKDYGAFALLKTGGLRWNTGLASLDGHRSLTLTWAVAEDGAFCNALKGWSDTAPLPFACLRAIPFGAEIHLTAHGLDHSMRRGYRHMSRDAVATNLKNLFAAHQASSEPIMQSFFVNKNLDVYPQFFLADGQGSVAVLRASPDNDLYHATTITPSMAGTQVSLVNSAVGGTRRWHNDGSGAPGVIA